VVVDSTIDSRLPSLIGLRFAAAVLVFGFVLDTPRGPSGRFSGTAAIRP